jgi:glutathione S-transferase
VKLYYWPRTRAFTSLWMMEELGEPYELVRVDPRAADHPSEAYRQINPMGKLGGFQDGACAMGETAAILLYVADKFPHKRFAPAPTDPRRGRFLQWLMFSPTTIEPAMVEKRAGTPPNSFQAGWGDYDRAMRALEGAMQPGRWLLGDEFTAADLYIASALRFGMQFGMIDKRAAFGEFTARALARPAYERAAAIEARETARAFPQS